MMTALTTWLGDVQWAENRATLRMRGVSSYCLFLPFSGKRHTRPPMMPLASYKR